MPVSLTPMGRLVPRRSWTGRRGIWLVIWSALAVVCIVFLLVILTLLTDLVVTRGMLSADEFSSADREQFPNIATGIDQGLCAQAVRFGGRRAWSWLPLVCQRFPWLQTSLGAALALVIGAFLCATLMHVFLTRARLASAGAARHTTNWLRKSIHRQTLRLGPSDLTGRRYQTALDLFTEECEHLREALLEWRCRTVRAWLSIPTLLAASLTIDWRLALQCLIPAGASWFLVRYERRHGGALRRLAEARADTEVRFLAEGLKQTRLVRGYNMEEFEQQTFEKHLERLTQETSAARKSERVALSIARLVGRAGVAVVVLLITLRTVSVADPLPLANGVAIAACLILLVIEANSMDMLSTLKHDLKREGDRVYRFLDEIPEVGQAVGAKFIQPISKSMVFESVHYEHQGSGLLKGVDLRIEAKTQIAVVSLDPAVPRVLAYMLPRFIEPTKGRVLFDGEDIAWGTLESIRSEVAFVGADDPVLAGTIYENLSCGDPRYSIQDAMEAAKMVHAHKFISRFAQGYETVLGEHGERLEPADGFRLGLARAILRDPAVIVIDEPKIPLDDDAKSLINDAYQRLAKGRTLIFLPSRLSTVRRCDQVAMLNNGQVEALGPHSELARSSELYRHWDYITFSTLSRQAQQPNDS